MRIAMVGHKRVPSREGGIEVVVEELAARMVMHGHSVTCYNRTGHHVSGKEYDIEHLDEYRGIRLKRVPTIDRKGLAAVTSSFFGCLAAAFGPYDVVHIHAEGPAMFSGSPPHRQAGRPDRPRSGLGTGQMERLLRLVVYPHGRKNRRPVRPRDHRPQSQHTKVFSGHLRPRHPLYPQRRQPCGPCGPGHHPGEVRPREGLLYPLSGPDGAEKGCHYLVDAFKKLHTDKKLVIAGGSSDTHWYIDQRRSRPAGTTASFSPASWTVRCGKSFTATPTSSSCPATLRECPSACWRP